MVPFMTTIQPQESFAEKSDDGFWRDNKGNPLRVSASDLERYTYCPLSWSLARQGTAGVGKAIEEGKAKHAEIHERVNRFKERQSELRRAMVIWSWWFTIILVFISDAIIFHYIDSGYISIPNITRYLTMLSISWLLVAVLAIYLPWRKFFNFDSNNEEYEQIKNFDETVIPYTFQPLGFIGGWGEGGRVEAGLLFAAIISGLHAIGLTWAEDKSQAAFILIVVAMVWTLLASWQLQKALLADNALEIAKLNAGLKEEMDVSYSDDDSTAGLLEDKLTGIRGRPDQIVIVDGEFIPMEQKTGKVPEKPHKSHEMQLLAYIHLVETTTNQSPPYGVLRYGEENLHQIFWTDENKNLLYDTTKEIQRLMVEGGAERNHERVGKCMNCSRRYACESSLVQL